MIQIALLLEEQCRGALLPAPVREYRFHPDRLWRLDFAWPDRHVALEVEGGVWRYGRHNRPAGYLRDLDKYNELALLGWTLLRVTPDMVYDGRALELLKRAYTQPRGWVGMEANS